MSADDAPRRARDVPPPHVEERLPWIRDRLEEASTCLVCLDFDGTLAPIVEDPADAEVTPDNRAALASLLERPDVRVAVVSGRALADVRERVGLPITYAGNHGLELASDGSIAVHPIADKRSTTIERLCAALEVALDPIPNARVENKRLTGTVHVRSVPEPARDPAIRIARDVVARFGGEAVETSPGKRIVEIEPALEWGKGDAVSLLARRIPGDPFVCYVGDDVTDESAFRAVEPEGLGVHVGGDRETAASCAVESPAAVAAFLRWLASAAAADGRAGDRSLASDFEREENDRRNG